ncbi:hypothetical protein B0H14DRAFT_3461868 [Mycena olivaceomarginata]|nr:hypothetical protein B0H14DRAFT_3461868 [Mycena olivaceomarginata]
MFCSASIVIASFLSLSSFSVNSAPVNGGARVVQQFCIGPNGTGTCTPLNGTSCTNTRGIQSLILNADSDCSGFPLVGCDFRVEDQFVLDLFSDESQRRGHLERLDIAQEAKDTKNGIAINV